MDLINLVTKYPYFMLYKQLVNCIIFSLLFIQTACNNTKHNHMLSHNQSQQYETPVQYIDHENCAICLEPLHSTKKPITILNCHHVFHEQCILMTIGNKYLDVPNIIDLYDNLQRAKETITCPYCRQPISDNLFYNPKLTQFIIDKVIEKIDKEIKRRTLIFKINNIGKLHMLLNKFMKFIEYLDNVNVIKDQDGNSLLHRVIKLNSSYKQYYHKATHQKPRQLDYPISSKLKKISYTLIHKNIDINAKNNQGWTPLHIAAAFNDVNMAKLLLQKHAQVNVTNDLGWTPLHLAIQFNSYGVLHYLIRTKADINAKAQLLNIENVNLTPIYLAIYYKQIDTLNQLIDEKANTNTKTICDLTPLHFAALCHNKHFLENIHLNTSNKDW